MAEPLLAIRGLRKRFGAITVTDGVSLDVMPGTIHALIGPNGAGKTSLIQQISGMLRPDAGSIMLEGHDITRMAPHRRARRGLGRGFQITSVFPEFSLLENVAIAVQSRAGSSFRFFRPAGTEDRFNGPAMAALERTGLAPQSHAKAGSISHGQQRQLELAMAMAASPRLLLLDEPLAGAGPEETARLIDLLAGLRRECAMLLVEHDMEAVFQLADTLTVLSQGQVIASGPAAMVRGDPAVRSAYLGEDF